MQSLEERGLRAAKKRDNPNMRAARKRAGATLRFGIDRWAGAAPSLRWRGRRDDQCFNLFRKSGEAH